MKRLMTTMALAGFAVFTAQPAAAQFGIGGGPTFPAGELDDATGAGWHVQGQLGFQPGMLPVGLRLDVGYQKLSGDEDFPDAVGDFNFQEIFGTLSAVIHLIDDPGLSPYVLGGVGFYGDRFDFESSDVEDTEDWQTNFGLNGGVGIDLPLAGYNTFVEARYQHVFTSDEDFGEDFSVQTFPVTFGIRF